MSMFTFMSAWPTLQALNAAQSAGERAGAAKDLARTGIDQVTDLRAQVDRMQMICEAMWTILKKQADTDDEALMALVREIDLRDGKLDGKSAKTGVIDCRKCGRTVSVRTGVCLYCGDRESSRAPF